MLRKPVVVLAIFLLLGNFGLSASAFARGGHNGSVRGDSFRGNHLRDFGGVADGSFGGNGNRDGGLRGDGNRDVWSHWGAYYGPMRPGI
jgi:hypothetical protein